MYVKTQAFLILGVSKSGFSAGEYLISKGGKFKFIEENITAKNSDFVNKLVEKGAEKVSAEKIDDALSNVDVLIISPGVPINHPIAVKAKQLGIRIVSELQFGFSQFMPTTIAVTGTNGKTTTVNLIDAILKENGIESEMVGNVGVPISSKINSTLDTVFVAEVSSFQLEGVSSFCPHVSCVLNVSPDHLERHYNMENYVFLKKRIFASQRESEICVLNFDDEIVRGFYTEVKAKVKWISVKQEVDGAYIKDGKLYYCGERIIDENELMLKGEHNVYNTLFAIACAKLVGAENNRIAEALRKFKGVKHRIEFVCRKNGVNYYNDSKATNTASTMSAIKCMEKPTVLILGGSEKGESYEELFEKIKLSQVKDVVLMGSSMLFCHNRF